MFLPVSSLNFLISFLKYKAFPNHINKQEIDLVLKNCRDSYNGHYPAAGYDELMKILTYELGKKNNIHDKVIELGPAYTLLPGFLLYNSDAKYIGTD